MIFGGTEFRRDAPEKKDMLVFNKSVKPWPLLARSVCSPGPCSGTGEWYSYRAVRRRAMLLITLLVMWRVAASARHVALGIFE